MKYESLTINQLKEFALDRGQTGYWSVEKLRTKSEIIKRLQEYDAFLLKEQEDRDREEALEEAHRKHRGPLQIQKGAEEYVESLEYPFSFLRSGEYPRDVSPIPGQAEEDIGDFPENIQEYLWIHPGENDEEPWMCLCRLKNDVYVFYKGECDYTGFDCQGNMELYAHRDPNMLIQYAMTIADYDRYMADLK